MASTEGESQHVDSREYAVSLDAQDPLRHLRREFLIPSKEQLKSKSLPEAGKTSIVAFESLLLNENRVS
jgi:kynureninase